MATVQRTGGSTALVGVRFLGTLLCHHVARMTGAISVQAIGVIVAVVLGLVNLAWQAVTWRILRAERKRASVNAHFEAQPFQLVVSNDGPATAEAVEATVLENVGEGRMPRLTDTHSQGADLPPNDHYALTVRPDPGLAPKAKVRLNWRDESGDHEKTLTLKVPAKRRSARSESSFRSEGRSSSSSFGSGS